VVGVECNNFYKVVFLFYVMTDGGNVAMLCEVWSPRKPAAFRLVVPRRDGSNLVKNFAYSPPSQRDIGDGVDSVLVGVETWKEVDGRMGAVDIRGPFVPTDVAEEMGFELELWFSLLAFGTALGHLYSLRNSRAVYKVHNDISGGRWRTMGIGRTEKFPYPDCGYGNFDYGDIVREFLKTSEAVNVNEGWYSVFKRGGRPAV
jgi:hypothetical protein